MKIKMQEDIGHSVLNQPNIFYTPNIQHHYSIAFTTDVHEPTFYDSVVHLLLTADENTTIDFLISSYGGSLDSFISIKGALEATKANVTGYLMAQSCSAAGMILLCCHNWVVNEFATFHAHTCSYGSYGKSDDVKQQVDYITKQTERIVRSVYDGILDKNEQDLLLAGKEFYFDDVEIRNRLIKREEMKAEKAAQDIQTALETPIDLSEYSLEELEEELGLMTADLRDLKSEINKRKKQDSNASSNEVKHMTREELTGVKTPKRKTTKEKQSATDASTLD